MSQVTSFTFPPDPSGQEVLTQIEEMLAALRSGERGSDGPTNPTPGMVWNDSSVTPPQWRVRRDDNAGWDMLLTQLIRGAGGLIVGIHQINRTTTYSRSTRAQAAFGAEIQITPVSSTSKLFVTGAHRIGLGQTGGDDDISGTVDLAAKSAAGAWTQMTSADETQAFLTNSGTNPNLGMVVPVSGWLADRYASKFVMSAYGGVGSGDATAGYAGSVSSYSCVLTCLEIEGL